MSRIVDVEPLDCLAWKDGEHGTTFDDGVLWVLEKIGELPIIEPQQTCEYWDSESKFCALCRPSAQPERPKGKWIPKSESGCIIECSSCGERITVLGDEHPNFCPYCGVDMRGEQND